MTWVEMNRVIVLEPLGDLHEGSECDEMERALLALADEGRHVLADLSGVHRLSAHCLGILATAHQRALANGGRIALCGINRFDHWLLERAGLSEVIAIYEDREAAVRSLAA